MKRTFLITIFTLTAFTVHAQKLPARQVARAVTLPTPIGARQLTTLRSGGMHDIADAVELSYLQASIRQQQAAAPMSTSAAIKKANSRPWLEQKQRNFKAWKLKHQRRQRDEQNRRDEKARQERAALEATLPRLNPEHAFETSSFAPFVIDELPAGSLPAQALPLLETPGVLYRGMALPADGNALENILTNGLLIKDLGSHATTKLLAISGGMRGTVSAVRPVTNLTSIPSEALHWGNQRVASESGKKLLVIVGVNGQHESGKVLLMSEDIPAGQLTDVIAPLQINGTPVWCNISLTPDQTFLVIPYDLPPLSTPEK